MIFASGCGLINLITPTSGVVMGGLEISKVQYATWTKFMAKPMIVLGLINLIILMARCYSLANQKFFMLGLRLSKRRSNKTATLPKVVAVVILIVVELTILRQRGQKKDFAQ